MMPTLTETKATAYAHCRNSRCPGNEQVEVEAVRVESAWTFGELGGDGPFVPFTERSSVGYRFANDEDAACPVCHESREIVGEPRPQYMPLSGKDPNFLIGGAKFQPGVVIEPGQDSTPSQELIELRAEMAEMRETLKALGKE